MEAYEYRGRGLVIREIPNSNVVPPRAQATCCAELAPGSVASIFSRCDADGVRYHFSTFWTFPLMILGGPLVVTLLRVNIMA